MPLPLYPWMYRRTFFLKPFFGFITSLFMSVYEALVKLQWLLTIYKESQCIYFKTRKDLTSKCSNCISTSAYWPYLTQTSALRRTEPCTLISLVPPTFLLQTRIKEYMGRFSQMNGFVQSVASSRHEISLGRYSQSDQRILPDHKEPLRRLTAEARKNAGGASASKGSHQRKRSQSRPQRGLQYFLHNMFRNNDSSIQVTSAEQPDYSVSLFL